MKHFNATVIATALLLFISTNFSSLYAQSSSDIGMGWDGENACSVYDRFDHFTIEQLADLPCLQVCEGTEFQYWVNHPFGADGVIINWTVIGGDIVDHPVDGMIVVVWNTASSAAGVYVQILTEEGDVYEFGICVNILEPPTARFNIQPPSRDLVYCLEQEIFFVNISTPNTGGQITGYHWDFGDGNTSNQFEPSHIYNTPGVYEVQLTVKNECFCLGTYKIKVTIQEMGRPIEISCPTVTCENAVESYTADAECEFFWSVEGGTIINDTENQPVVEILWDNIDETGFGWVSLVLEGCDACPVPSVVKVPVVQEKGHIIGEDIICNGKQYRYSLPQWPTTDFQWTLTDINGSDFSQYLLLVHQRNEILVSPQGLPYGDYILRSVYFNTLKHCTGMAEKKITILNAYPQIQGPESVCAGESFTFETDNPDPNTNWVLENNDGEIVDIHTGSDFHYIISDSGKYIISATNPNSCEGVGFVFTVYALPPTPQGTFTIIEDICPNIIYEISLNNSNFNPAEYNIEWLVGNGSINGPANNPMIEAIFNENPIGDYTVSVRYIRKSKPRCASNWLVSPPLPPAEVNTTIEPYNPVTGNAINSNTFCTSSQVHFRVDELGGDLYEWEFLNSNFGSIVQGQGTPEIVVNLHEITQSQITNPLSLRIQICGVWFNVDPFVIEKIGAPIITWNPPTDICTGESFTVSFSANIGNQQLGTFNQAILDLGNGQIFNNFVNTGAFSWAFHNVSFNPIFNTSVNHNMTLTLIGPEGCTQDAFASHQVTVYPTPVATISANFATVTYCEESDIPAGLTLTATETGGIVNVTNWVWYRNGIQVGTGVTLPVNQFGSYTVKAIGAYPNACEGLSSPYKIMKQNCTGGTGCSEWIEITDTEWTQCGAVEVTYSYSTPPNQITWSTMPINGLDLVSTSSTTAEFVPNLPGAYTVTALASWNCGSKRVSEIALVAYQAQLNFSITCNALFGGYNVTLYNDSPYVSGYQPDETIFSINGPTPHYSHNNYHRNNQTFLIAPGSYTFNLEIGRTGYPSCTSIPIAIDLVSPTASFNLPSAVCEGDPVLLAPTTSLPGHSYLWQFNGTTDAREELEVTLVESQNTTITLVVTDPWGCSAEYNNNSLTVYSTNYDGNIVGHEGLICFGETRILSYDPQGGATPVNYQWFFNGNQINGTAGTGTILEVDTSGSYGLLLTNNQGCTQRIDPVSVKIIPLPSVSIEGPESAICAGIPFDLEGIVEDDTILRRWLREGIVIHPLSTTTPWELEGLVENSPGSFEYTLEIVDNNNGGCENSYSFMVEVSPSPTENDVQLDFQVNCSPFELVATIINPDPVGTYNWSNGDFGTQTTVNHTGLLAVRYTNQWGCSVWVEIPIPALPEEHMWIFPTGCFESCENPELNSSYVIGPWPEYDSFTWLWDGSGNQDGGIQVPPQHINQEGSLQLELGTEIYGVLCELTSGSLQVTNSHRGCEPCEGEIEVHIEDVRQGQQFPYIYYEVYMQIINNYGITLTFQFTSPDGIYIPNNVTVGGGQSVGLQLQFIPNAAFTGGNSDLFVQVLHNGDKFCYLDEIIEYPALTPTSITESQPELMLVPNPAEQIVNVHYNLNERKQGKLIVYSLLGIAIIEQNITQNSGMIPLDLGNLSSGTYIVIINDDTGQRMQKVLLKK